MALLEISGLTKSYGVTPAVSDLSFAVERGEFFTLLGPSGCGKTTTLMMIAGFEHPESGRIVLDGRDITRTPPNERGMGVVFQSYALFPHMSVLENVMFPLRMRGIKGREAEARALAALAQVELTGREREHPARLSGGQRQRVALARALVFDPAVLLMDEPLAALDRRLRQTMQYELRELQAAIQTTVLYVTHDQEEALVLSDRIGVMRDGSFEQVDDPRQLYDNPANPFVANFLGESNRLAVSVTRQGMRSLLHPLADPQQTLIGPSWEGEGHNALLLIRPENVTLANGARPATMTSCSGIVTDIVFVGDHIRIEVEVCGGEHWKVPVHPQALAGHRLGRGSVVTLAWEPDQSRLVEETP